MAHSVRDCAMFHGEGALQMNSFTSQKYYLDSEALNAFISLRVMSAIQYPFNHSRMSQASEPSETCWSRASAG